MKVGRAVPCPPPKGKTCPHAGRFTHFQSRPAQPRQQFLIRQRPKFLTPSAPMKSMTGYGRGDCSQDGFKITVELSSVNRKQSEISVNLPRELEMLEAPMRDLINRYIARGRLTVRVGLHSGESRQSA